MLCKWYLEVQALNFGKVLVMLCAHLTSAAWQDLFRNVTKYLGLADLYYKLKRRS